ncbi:MAG: shikimate kinase [Thermoplasmata archaeon]|nr:shikimate kinase [Thermoplasmata archaeon]
MNGVGRGSGAITFLNALFTGTGSAAGIALYADAEIELELAAETSVGFRDPSSDTPLTRTTVEEALRGWAGARHWTAHVGLDSSIPVARGLKSSSGVGVALARAVASALSHPASNEEVARVAADVAQRVGLSATGAFDDCLAAAEPGIHVTDNPRRRRLRTDPVDPTWKVLVAVPADRHAPSPNYHERFRAEASAASEAEAASVRGDPLAAMESNSALVERLMGYDFVTLRARLLEAGAIGCGVAGMGPAFAVLTSAERLAPVRAELERSTPSVLVTDFTSSPGGPGAEHP